MHTRHDSELARVGNHLASQLSCQLRWDEGICRAVLSFLDNDLYGSDNSSDHGKVATEKLRVWADAMARMIKIDKTLWEFVEHEVYGKAELDGLEEEGRELPEILDGETSTRVVPVARSEGMIERRQENVTSEQSSGSRNPNFVEKGGLHECIVSSSSVEEAVTCFINGEIHRTEGETGGTPEHFEQRNRPVTSILFVGEEGCGKTHLLDSFQRCAAEQKPREQSVRVIRPKHLSDLVGSSIGSSEDRLIALFAYASRIVSSNVPVKKCLVMLDDIDRMYFPYSGGNSESSGVEWPAGGGTAQYFVDRGRKALFLFIMDALRKRWPSTDDGNLLLLCTSRLRCDDFSGRFDVTFRSGQPNARQRRRLITSCLSPANDALADIATKGKGNDIETILSFVVNHSAGRSLSELAQYCREVILSSVRSVGPKEETNSLCLKQRIQYLDKMLRAKSPQSLHSGSLDGIVDMRVLTPEELRSRLTMDANGEPCMPLLGADAKRALEALMNAVIIPFSRSDEIRDLLYGESGNVRGIADVKRISVGVLLVGAPGVGKTSLVYHCASLAANISGISLLDVSCTSLIHKEMGGSERSVRRLFEAARAAAPCLLLLDGIECVASQRGNDSTTGGTMDRVLSTFLTEMDGIDTGDGVTSGNVAVIGISHNPQLIDPSLLRPGRLEKTITLGAPDFKARKEIVSRQIDGVAFNHASASYFDARIKDDVSSLVALESDGLTAAEVMAICREASMECLRELKFKDTKKPVLTYEHFKRAVQTMKGRKS